MAFDLAVPVSPNDLTTLTIYSVPWKTKRTLTLYTLILLKVFDKYDYGIIANKLKRFGMLGKVGLWIYYFLSHRLQRVVLDNCRSAPSTDKSSVPYGTVLAPILFLILISDID